jgi:hypothetical protein
MVQKMVGICGFCHLVTQAAGVAESPAFSL